MKKPYIPELLYEILPALYAIIGVLGLYSTQGSAVGLISSLAIMAAALGIWLMRRKHRNRRSQAELSGDAAEKYLIPDFVYEKLPLLYAIAGVAGLYFAGRNVVGLISSLFLHAMALSIWFMRRNHRFGVFRGEMLQRIRAFKVRQEKCGQDESYRQCHQCDPDFSQRCDRPWATRGQTSQRR